MYINKNTIAFHNGSNYDNHFIIKELVEEFERQFTCSRESTEKYITFSVPIKKVTRIDNNGEEITKTIPCRLWFIESARFMANSLPSLVNNLAEGIHKIKRKNEQDNKKCESFGVKYKYCDYFLQHKYFKDDWI